MRSSTNRPMKAFITEILELYIFQVHKHMKTNRTPMQDIHFPNTFIQIEHMTHVATRMLHQFIGMS